MSLGEVWLWLALVLLVVVVLVAAMVMDTVPKCKVLALYFVSDVSELEYFDREVVNKLMDHPHVTWYLAKFDNGRVVTLDGHEMLSPMPPAQWFERVLASGAYDGLVYSGHSGGPYLGNENKQMIRIDEFVRILRATGRRLSFIWFDSCNMGFLQSLVLMNGVAKYVVGAPNYYDWHTVLQTREIYHLCRGDSRELEHVIKSQVSKYDTSDVLVELCLYRPDRLNTLWMLYKEHWRRLRHDANTQIEDDYHDVSDVIRLSAGQVDARVLRVMKSSLESGVVSRRRCRECAVGVRDSTLAVQMGRDLDGRRMS